MAMARQFGRLTQLGYVVRDLDRAMNYWIRTLGVGPFFVVSELVIPEIVYRGKTQPLTMSFAYSHSGGVQIELVAYSEQPSIFKEAIQQGLKGVHHLGYMVDDFAAAIRCAQAGGLEPIQSGTFGGTSFAYYDTGEAEAVAIIELTETSPAKLQRFETVRDAAENWDGLDPIRVTAPAKLGLRGK